MKHEMKPIFHLPLLKDQITMGIIIAALSLAMTIFIIAIACLVCSKKNQEKREQKSQADKNPVYEEAADYEYDEMGNYDTLEESTIGKKEVKAEVVDRCSIYGEKEEGWEDAVAVDNNPDYGE